MVGTRPVSAEFCSVETVMGAGTPINRLETMAFIFLFDFSLICKS